MQDQIEVDEGLDFTIFMILSFTKGQLHVPWFIGRFPSSTGARSAWWMHMRKGTRCWGCIILTRQHRHWRWKRWLWRGERCALYILSKTIIDSEQATNLRMMYEKICEAITWSSKIGLQDASKEEEVGYWQGEVRPNCIYEEGVMSGFQIQNFFSK